MRWVVAAFAISWVAFGCSDSNECRPRVVETDEECQTTSDCIEAGFTVLSCFNGKCAKTCTRDGDCASAAKLSDEEAKECPNLADARPPTFICEAQRCITGCPDVACNAGEDCIDGRCVFFSEGFELRGPSNFITLESIGWNRIAHELENNRTRIVYEGVSGCSRGEDKCAGPPGEGSQYVAVERVPTPERSTPELTTTCRACACCVECLLTTPTTAPSLLRCPQADAELIDAPMCPTSMPAVCSSVCTQCESCMAAPSSTTIGEGLLTCERSAALKTCSACASGEECDPTMSCPCNTCRDAIRCDLETPGSSTCNDLQADCDAQGADGCFSTPIARPRSMLTDDEQALESPVIDLSNTPGNFVIEFEYVPFDIREEFRRVIQGAARETWPIETQEVVVQLCASACDLSASWVDANLVDGRRASLPLANAERRNGLRLGAQSAIDWRSGRVLIDIPETARASSEFQFRFVPRLSDGSQFGIDNIRVRRRSP